MAAVKTSALLWLYNGILCGKAFGKGAPSVANIAQETTAKQGKGKGVYVEFLR